MANYNTKNTKITSSDGQQQRKAELERRRSIRTIIASYEAEEEAFLKELEKMQAECEEENLTKLNNLTLNSSNEKQKLIENEEQQPAIMLGTMCTLLGEITKLQKQNNRLKHRLKNKNKLKNKEDEEGGGEDENKKEILNKNKNNLLSNYLIKSGCTAAICSLPSKRLFNNVGNNLSTKTTNIDGEGNTTNSFCFPLLQVFFENKQKYFSLKKSSGNSTSCSSAVSELFSRQKRLLINNCNGGGGEGTIGGRFLTMSGSGGSRGAQEQLSPLPPINKIGCVNSLSVSAYSADLSSDSSGLCRKNFALNNQINNQPKLGESELLFDDEWELENCEKDLNNSNFNHRRKMERRADEQQQQQFLRLSNSLTSGTSLSVGSSSASSSVEPPINTNNLMTSSKNSLLELFGFGASSRRNQWRKQLNNNLNKQQSSISKIVDNLVINTRKVGGGNKKRRKGKNEENEEGGNNKRHSTALLMFSNENTDGYSSSSGGGGGGGNLTDSQIKIESEPSNKQQFLIKCRNNKNNNKRPQSCFLETNKNNNKLIIKEFCKEDKEGKFKINTNHHQRQQQNSENDEIKLEIQLLKSRNARLIDQLREKSSLISSSDSKINNLIKELKQLKSQQYFNQKIGNICFKTILFCEIEENIKKLNEKINKQINEQLQIIKLETQKYQRINLNANVKDKQASFFN